jgi:endonuclease I
MPRLTISIALLCANLAAQAPPTYYSSVNAASASTLRQTLHARIHDHTRIPYTATGTDTWVVLELADQNPANTSAILDLYKNSSYIKVGGGTGPYDREHSWPKSYGFPNDVSTNYPYTDCHHLFLCDSVYNSTRSNKAYATTNALASERATTLTNGVGGGSGSYPGFSNWTDSILTTGRWETWTDRRGDVARALFYLDVRYEGGTHGITGAAEPNLILTDDPALIAASNTGINEAVGYMGLLSTLLQWHLQDPVDAREIRRNDVVYSYQGNRNPFIDHPEWVACLWGNNCTSGGGGTGTAPAAPQSLIATPGNTKVTLDWADNTEPDLASYVVYRANRSGGPYAQFAGAEGASDAMDSNLINGKRYYYVVKAINAQGQVSAASAEVSAVPAPPAPPQPSTLPWINEFHYDNTGADTGEFFEIAGAAGTNLTGWTLVAYNGANGQSYATVNLSGVLPNQQNGYGTLSFALVLQNGAPDGFALVSPTNVVVQFLSYEGTMTATNGPASGLNATAIPTSESEATPVGYSLQLQGTGSRPAVFTWSNAIVATPGQPNTGQTLRT